MASSASTCPAQRRQWLELFGHAYDWVNDHDTVERVLADIRRDDRREAAEAAKAAGILENLRMLPLDDLLVVPAPQAWTLPEQGSLTPCWALPQPAAGANFTPLHRTLALSLVKYAVAELKATKNTETGELILAQHAVTNDIYVAAALALHSGWSRHKNGKPHPTDALRAMLDLPADAPVSGSATGAVKSWLARLEQAPCAQHAIQLAAGAMRVQLNGARVAEAMRRGVGPRTVSESGRVLGTQLYTALCKLPALAGIDVDSAEHDLPGECRGTCDGAAHLDRGLGAWTCTCTHEELYGHMGLS